VTRAAIYARMSTDKQSEASPADQVRECRRFAERRGFDVVPELVFEEAGISGASRHNRPRLLELIARIDEWDVLVCFDFSRVARNQEDLGWVANRLRLHRRQAFEASTGLDLANVGARVMGVMAEEYLAKLAAETRRGLRGRVERGHSGGGLPYGYRSEPAGPGPRDGRRLMVDAERADHVRTIFGLHNAGRGYREIAHALNSRRIPSPRSRRRDAGRAGTWAPSAIREVLRNPIYRGEYVWNRSEWIKDHETGRRRRYERPESEWVRRQDEALRIVSDEVWWAAQARMGRSTLRRRERERPGRPLGSRSSSQARHALSGLLVCGMCGGGFYAINGRGRYGCAWHKDRGPEVCASTLLVGREELEARVIDGLRLLLAPDRVRRVVSRAIEALRAEEPTDQTSTLLAQLAATGREIENIVDLAATHGASEAVRRKLTELEARKARIEAELREKPGAPASTDWKALRDEAEALLVNLPALIEAAGAADVREALAAYLGEGRLTIHAEGERGFRLEGRLTVPPCPWLETRDARNPAEFRASRLQVAGAGFEPATCGL
jgi:site-specific DNA recombinase